VVFELTLLTAGMAAEAVGAVEDITGNSGMLCVGFILAMGVAIDAGEQLFVFRHSVAFGAVLPLVVMGTGEDGEEQGVMIAELSFFTAGMTEQAVLRIPCVSADAPVLFIHFLLVMLVAAQAGDSLAVFRLVVADGAVVDIAGDALVLFIHLLLVVLMAAQAGELFSVVEIGVARGAVIPFTFVLAGEDRKKQGIVIRQKSRFPAIHLMALLAIGAEAEGEVVGLAGFEKILLMAALAGAGGDGKIHCRRGGVAALAVEQDVPALHGKGRLRMDGFGVEFQPVDLGMAFFAVIARFAEVAHQGCKQNHQTEAISHGIHPFLFLLLPAHVPVCLLWVHHTAASA